MSLPDIKVELGLDFSNAESTNFFTLDDATQGVLDNSTYTLAGLLYYDITEHVRSLQISRGKPRRFSTFPAGAAGIRLNNQDRTFDPLYPDSPFAGQIVPRREIRVTAGTGIQFTGFVEDWNLNYSLNGDSIADAVAADVTSFFSKQLLSAGTPTEQLSGARVNAILDSAEVDWPADERDIDTGDQLLGTQEIEASTVALTYLQEIARTEQALLFIDKQGRVSYKTGTGFQQGQPITVFSQGTGIHYSGIQVVYGSELLYNEVVVSNIGGGTATATDLDSQAEYGVRNLTLSNLLGANDAQSILLAEALANQYSQPEYRVEVLQVKVHSLSPAQQIEVLNLELGSIARVEFTPNDIGNPIIRTVRVISIKHDVDPENYMISFGFEETQFPLVLDDPSLGILGTQVLGEPNEAWTLGDPILGRLSAGMTLS